MHSCFPHRVDLVGELWVIEEGMYCTEGLEWWHMKKDQCDKADKLLFRALFVINEQLTRQMHSEGENVHLNNQDFPAPCLLTL